MNQRFKKTNPYIIKNMEQNNAVIFLEKLMHLLLLQIVLDINVKQQKIRGRFSSCVIEGTVTRLRSIF